MTPEINPDRADVVNHSDPADVRGHVIAIVSGKGGTGKTMLAAEIARLLSAPDLDIPVTLVDADLGTGGLSYYFAIKQIRNIKQGLIDLLFEDDILDQSAVLDRLQPLRREPGDVNFLPVGNFSRLGPRVGGRYPSIDESSEQFVTVFRAAVTHLRRPDRVVIVDCRGGIDEEMIAICALVDQIVLISEADTTSFQASQHLMEALSEASLAHRVTGFILNKVFEDPAAVIRNGTAVFGVQSLGSIPFDFEATRAFLIGDIPSSSSVFGTHVCDALSRAYPRDVEPPIRGIWTPNDYSSLSLASPASSRGGIFLGILILLLGMSLILALSLNEPGRGVVQAVVAALTIAGLLSSVEPLRRLIGSAIGEYVKSFKRIGKGRSAAVLGFVVTILFGAAIPSLLPSISLIPTRTPTSVTPTSVTPTSVEPPTATYIPPDAFPALVEEERLVELSAQAGQESVEIDTWRQVGDISGDLLVGQDGIYTALGAELSVIQASSEATYERCSQIQDWTTRVDFMNLNEGSQICAKSRGGRYATLQVRALPESPGSNGRFVFYGTTWQLDK